MTNHHHIPYDSLYDKLTLLFDTLNIWPTQVLGVFWKAARALARRHGGVFADAPGMGAQGACTAVFPSVQPALAWALGVACVMRTTQWSKEVLRHEACVPYAVPSASGKAGVRMAKCEENAVPSASGKAVVRCMQGGVEERKGE